MTVHSPNALYVPNASPRTHVRVAGAELVELLSQTTANQENADDVVLLSAKDGTFHLIEGDAQPRPEESVMPLRFGPLARAFETIGDKQEWLLDHQPVIKTEGNGDTRIDFINYGGFVFDSAGGYLSHSVNAW